MKVVIIFVFAVALVSCAKSPVACTLDEKLCFDGSSIGRVPPNCQFASCPVVADSMFGCFKFVNGGPSLCVD